MGCLPTNPALLSNGKKERKITSYKPVLYSSQKMPAGYAWTLEVMEEDKSEFRSAGGLHLGTESVSNVVASLPTVAAINWAALNGGTEEKFLCRKGQKTSFTKGRKYLH